MDKNYHYEFPRPSVTATVAMFVVKDGKISIVLGKRGQKTRAYPGYWSLPGGFLDARVDDNDIVNPNNPNVGVRVGETVEETAHREVLEETGLALDPNRFNLVTVLSRSGTDPRAHVVNVCFSVVLSSYEIDLLRAGDDLDEIQVIPFNQITDRKLAFNHMKIAQMAVRKTAKIQTNEEQGVWDGID